MNPARMVRRPSPARGRERRLSKDEEKRLIEACRASSAPMLAPIVAIALQTAMRLGELMSLEWKHIDLRTRVATLPETKNGELRRVPLSSGAIGVLHQLPRNLANGRVFWRWSRADSFENAWRRAVKAAGLEDFRFHDLRHEATTRFFEQGLGVMEVAAITGHKTMQMLKRYTHLHAEELVARLG